MDIVEFFQLSSGKWFSQRTSHDLDSEQSQSGKSDMQIDLLDKSDPDVIKLCEQYAINPELALCGARVAWDGTIERDKKKQTGSTLLVPIADAETPNAGKLLRAKGPSETTLVAGRYLVGTDETLTLISESDTLYSEERLWFAAPNLRLRTSVLKHSNGSKLATFCTEIRMGMKPQPPEEAVAQSVEESKV